MVQSIYFLYSHLFLPFFHHSPGLHVLQHLLLESFKSKSKSRHPDCTLCPAARTRTDTARISPKSSVILHDKPSVNTLLKHTHSSLTEYWSALVSCVYTQSEELTLETTFVSSSTSQIHPHVHTRTHTRTHAHTHTHSHTHAHPHTHTHTHTKEAHNLCLIVTHQLFS